MIPLHIHSMSSMSVISYRYRVQQRFTILYLVLIHTTFPLIHTHVMWRKKYWNQTIKTPAYDFPRRQHHGTWWKSIPIEKFVIQIQYLFICHLSKNEPIFLFFSLSLSKKMEDCFFLLVVQYLVHRMVTQKNICWFFLCYSWIYSESHCVSVWKRKTYMEFVPECISIIRLGLLLFSHFLYFFSSIFISLNGTKNSFISFLHRDFDSLFLRNI